MNYLLSHLLASHWDRLPRTLTLLLLCLTFEPPWQKADAVGTAKSQTQSWKASIFLHPQEPWLQTQLCGIFQLNTQTLKFTVFHASRYGGIGLEFQLLGMSREDDLGSS